MAELRKNSSKRRGSKVPQIVTHDIKCVALGDGDVGKSAMLLTYLLGRFPEGLHPGPMDGHTEYDHLTRHPSTFKQDNVEVRLTLVDNFGLDEYYKLRERICASADVYMLCFDVSRPVSFERIRYHWLPEMRQYSAPDTPFIVVGLKTDIRSKAQTDGSDMDKFVSFGDALREANELGAFMYLECSAFNNTGVKRVIEKAALAAIEKGLPADVKRSSCVVS